MGTLEKTGAFFGRAVPLIPLAAVVAIVVLAVVIFVSSALADVTYDGKPRPGGIPWPGAVKSTTWVPPAPAVTYRTAFFRGIAHACRQTDGAQRTEKMLRADCVGHARDTVAQKQCFNNEHLTKKALYICGTDI